MYFQALKELPSKFIDLVIISNNIIVIVVVVVGAASAFVVGYDLLC